MVADRMTTGRGFSMEFADPSGYTVHAGTRGFGAAEIAFYGQR